MSHSNSPPSLDRLSSHRWEPWIIVSIGFIALLFAVDYPVHVGLAAGGVTIGALAHHVVCRFNRRVVRAARLTSGSHRRPRASPRPALFAVGRWR